MTSALSESMPGARPIDDAARDGRFQIVLRADQRDPARMPAGGWPCALARHVDGEWHLTLGKLDFEPTHYKPRKD
ncbi:hypothetical protein [Novosphingobium mangrovi (ex Huang et al. 2023)]|uniref:Uncharacterized protein n=1 Tax=Novosphingobium mangrovi (ex Huang et al. 2023) TaxID=2976432 RepID=A0ABT2I108_9SPHN|nr:hypothetical protein [Novosphingobium mangrovi (ex Huang et al. 2023)]MCT2398491.1 hypothetical protein [Novosphingobium mangrovi (ex Huang et al. 2023)]